MDKDITATENTPQTDSPVNNRIRLLEFFTSLLSHVAECGTAKDLLTLVYDNLSALEEVSYAALYLVHEGKEAICASRHGEISAVIPQKLVLPGLVPPISKYKVAEGIHSLIIKNVSELPEKLMVVPFLTEKSTIAFLILITPLRDDDYENFKKQLGQACSAFNSYLNRIYLHQKVNQYTALVKNAGGAYILVTTQGEITDCNPSAANLFKVNKTELRGMNLSRFLPGNQEELRKFNKEIWNCLSTGESATLALKLQNSDHEILETEVTLTRALLHEEFMVQLIIRDRSLEKRSKRRVMLANENNIHLRHILTELDLCEIKLDLSGHILYTNSNFSKLTGFYADELLGKNFFSLFCYEKQATNAYEKFIECISSRKLKEAKRWDLCGKDGELRSLHFNFVYDYDDDGHLTGLSCIGRDTTEYNYTIEALHDNRMQMQDLIDNAYDLIQTIDRNYRFTFTNRAWQRRLGFGMEELEELTLLDVVHPDYAEELKQQIETLYNGSPHKEIETVFVTKAGENIFLRGSFTCQYLHNMPVATRAILHDETQRITADRIQKVYYKIADLAISTNDLQSLYKGIHAELSKIIDTTNIYLAFHDERAGEIYFPYYVDQNSPETLVNYRRPFQKGLTEYIIHTQKPLLATKEQINELTKQGQIQPFGKLPDIFMGSPLIISDRIIGVVALQSSKSAKAYSKQDLDILHFISNQIALAIERKHNEEQIKNHKARLEAIFESSSHIMWSVNRNLQLKSYNRNYALDLYKYFGIHAEEQLDLADGKTFFRNDRNYSFWLEKYSLAFEGKPQHFVVKFEIENEESWREIHLNPIFLEKNEFDEVSGISQDITEKRKKEIALKESEEKFRRIFESILDVYYRTDMKGYILHMSPSVTETFGYTTDEVVGMHGSAFYYYATDRELLLKSVLQHDKVRNFETSMVRKDGTVIQVILNSQLVRDKDGTPIGIEGVAKDITELNETQTALIKAKEQAENLLKVKSQFLANMSHELRTPMNGIIGMIELLGQTQLPAEQREYIETLRKSSDALLIILNDILDLSKIQAGKLDVNITTINIEHCLEKIHSLFLNRAFQKGLNFTFEVQGNVPKYINTDEIRLLQILSNLISNAIKFTNSGSVLLRVSPDDVTEKCLLFEVIDTGIGIRKESQHLLFNNFSQLDPSSSKTFGGTGLGLAISLQLTWMLGGQMGVDSDYGKGSKFWFSIKYEEPGPDEIKLIEEKSEPKSQIHSLTWQPKVLLVDDNQINQRVGERMLEKIGCQVDIAENGFRAIELAQSNFYHLIFMDIQMPEMDGIEATGQIKSKLGNNCPPIIAMTAYSMKNDASRFISLGMDDYISKPVKQADFLRIIHKWEEKIKIQAETRPKNAGNVINLEIVHQLREMGGNEFALQLYTDFEEEAGELISEIVKNIDKAKNSVILANLHQLKGTAGTLGLQHLAAQAKTMEEEIKSGNLETLPKETEALQNLFLDYKNTYRDLFNFN